MDNTTARTILAAPTLAEAYIAIGNLQWATKCHPQEKGITFTRGGGTKYVVRLSYDALIVESLTSGETRDNAELTAKLNREIFRMRLVAFVE